MNEQFWDVVNRYIVKANEIKEETSMPQASSAMLYAAARYNALNIINKHPELDRENEIKEHIEMYESFLRSSIEHLKEEMGT